VCYHKSHWIVQAEDFADVVDTEAHHNFCKKI
jgi:hypothetical protein